ncbi:MAG: class I SAM-dependent methyltransferase, partial [Nitrosopumilaceae archaeon]
FKVGGIEQLPYADNTFDLVCSIGVIEYLPSYHKAIVEFYRVLKPGGKLVLSTTSNRSPAHYLKPLVEYGKKIPYIAKKFNTKFRNFSVALHHIPTFKRDVLDVGFWFREEVYFFMLLYPRPFNLLFPKLSEKLEKYLDKFTNTALKHLAEGYIIVGKK